jgi:toxin ParE1/3/4
VKLSWTKRAVAKLYDIHNYIAERNPDAAGKVVADIVKAAQLLPQFPLLGLASDDPDVRLLQVPGRPYLLPYQVIENEIEILTVFDERQKRPEKWK